jgi:uncharacterized glyoxalase superfamily protein PhnB
MSQHVFALLSYADARAAIKWLGDAFGFEPAAVHNDEVGRVAHAELRFRDSVVMLGDEAAASSPLFRNHLGEGWLYVAVEDPDGHYERAKAAGAEIVMELTDQDYGSRDYSCRDPEGNLWSFGTYVPDAVS